MRLSVIIPVYNEEATLEEIIRRVRATRLVDEIVVVDDGSADKSLEILERLKESDAPPLRIIQHEKNRGKGAAMRTGLDAVTGDLTLVQDADLEYDPTDYPALLKPFDDNSVEVVYGSRNLRRNPKSSLLFYWGGRFLSIVTNVLYGARITDEATGYKVIKTSIMRDVGLETDGFEFCPEITAKILNRGIAIHEVPISYHPRSWDEGKKIQWYDGVIAVWTLVKYRFFYKESSETVQPHDQSNI